MQRPAYGDLETAECHDRDREERKRCPGQELLGDRRRAVRGNFSKPRRTKTEVHVSKVLLPPPIRRAFALGAEKVVGTFRDAPYVFFAVVIGVALSFRIAIGWVKEASTPPEVAPTFTTTPVVHEPAAGAAPAETARSKPSEPVDGRPSGVRASPKPRGHGRRGR